MPIRRTGSRALAICVRASAMAQRSARNSRRLISITSSAPFSKFSSGPGCLSEISYGVTYQLRDLCRAVGGEDQASDDDCLDIGALVGTFKNLGDVWPSRCACQHQKVPRDMHIARPSNQNLWDVIWIAYGNVFSGHVYLHGRRMPVGNSFDHLVGAQQDRLRDFEAADGASSARRKTRSLAVWA